MPSTSQPGSFNATAVPRRSGFTLVETVISLSILSAIVVGMGAAVMISVRSIEPGTPSIQNVVTARRPALDLATDLQSALTFTTRTATEIEFTVPDRDGDLADETIRYVWAGAGAPLTRQYNGGDVVNLIDVVQTFDLDYGLRAVPTDDAPPGVEGPEIVGFQQDAGTGGTGSSITLSDLAAAQHFVPALPGDALSWRITRLQLTASKSGGDVGIMSVSIRPSLGKAIPADSKIDEVLVAEASLPRGGNTWHPVTFTSAGGLDPKAAYFVVLEDVGPGDSGKVKINGGATGTPESVFASRRGVDPWVEEPTTDLRVWVWIRVTTPDPSYVPTTVDHVRSITITLNTSTEPSEQVQVTARTLNEPPA